MPFTLATWNINSVRLREGLVAKLIPQSLAAEAIEGEKQNSQVDQQVTIKVVTDQSRDVLPPREVEGELVHDDDGANVTH